MHCWILLIPFKINVVINVLLINAVIVIKILRRKQHLVEVVQHIDAYPLPLRWEMRSSMSVVSR